jgi:hypothetical protein
VGLKHSSPSTVMEHMPPHEQITTERIKSHLQKYRLHRQKAKKEFMTSYQATMAQINSEGLSSLTSLAGGQVAAHLSYVSEHHPDPDPDAIDDTENTMGESTAAITPITNDASNANDETKYDDETTKANNNNSSFEQAQSPPVVSEEPAQDIFYLPKLTETELASPIGMSLGYLMGLFFSLRQQLEMQRQEHAAVLAAQVQQQEQQRHLYHHDIGQPQQMGLFNEFSSEQGGRKLDVNTSVLNPVQSSSRNNLEVNSLIKREMQNQMAFQNKMRALKQQELNKYQKGGDGGSAMDGNNTVTSDPINEHNTMTNDIPQRQQHQVNVTADPSSQHRRSKNTKQQQQQQEYQGAGESGGADSVGNNRDRAQSVSLVEEDDFWNSAVVDDELFDFLMNS